MIFLTTRLADARLIRLEPATDDRGFFARTWCGDEMARAGLEAKLAQQSLSHTLKRGTIRGLHLQRPPHEEAKVVRCVAGKVFDVMVDLRPQSPTYLAWEGIELSATNRTALYVPPGFAHGFQTLSDDTDVLYDISVPYAPTAATGYRYDDPAFKIVWALPPFVISERDLSWPPYRT
jgi:dTDP-4-dehydrorhamnose 3,5-epimerase